MVKKFRTTKLERSYYIKYKTVAINFFEGAKVASEFEYWNAAGVLIVHSAIAYGDAITIKFGKVKSRGDDHQNLVSLIDFLVIESQEKKNALVNLSKIIDQKNLVSYSGDVYSKKDIDKLWKYMERFKSFAESILS